MVAGALVLEVAVTVLFGFSDRGDGTFPTLIGAVAGSLWFQTVLAFWRNCLPLEQTQQWDLKGRWPQARRRQAAGIAAIVWAIAVLLAHVDAVLPYTVGGAVFVMVLWALLNFTRVTPAETAERSINAS